MSTIVKILTKPKYLIISVSVALILTVFAIWSSNLYLIVRTLNNSNMTFRQKTNLLISLLGSLETNFTVLSGGVMITSAILAGIQTSLFLYYLHRSIILYKTMGLSGLGMVTSFLGITCVSCGSVILTALIGFGSAVTLIGLLPFKGEEFGLIGIVIQLFAVIVTARKINQAITCFPANPLFSKTSSK